jgi:AcrR family transcriptional regulator
MKPSAVQPPPRRPSTAAKKPTRAVLEPDTASALPGGTLSERRLARRREVLDTAAALFGKKGYHATTIGDIADALGMQKGSLYYYFGSKQKLLAELVAEVHAVFLVNLETCQVLEGDALFRLRAFIEGHVQRFKHHRRGSLLTSELRHLEGEARRAALESRHRYERVLSEMLSDGQAEGACCPDLDVQVTATAMLSSLNAVATWHRPGRDPDFVTLGRMYADVLLRGVACSPEEHHTGHMRTLGRERVEVPRGGRKRRSAASTKR